MNYQLSIIYYELSFVTYGFMFGQRGGGHSGIISGSFQGHSFQGHSGVIPGSFRRQPNSFRGHSGVKPGPFWGLSGATITVTAKITPWII